MCVRINEQLYKKNPRVSSYLNPIRVLSDAELSKIQIFARKI